MNKSPIIDIPEDDISCWSRYPKHRWVYELTRLLDSQHIKWALLKTDELSCKIQNMQLDVALPATYDPGHIYVAESSGNQLLTEVFVVRGEVRLLRHIDVVTKTEVTDNTGSTELIINAFVATHFHKFTGVLSVTSIGNNIMRIQLKPQSDLVIVNIQVEKLLKRIYKKTI